jgi:diguanylate cyclase (GGDEF)-like protein
VLADAALLGFAASRLTVHGHDLWLFGCLLVCSAATVELTRRVATGGASVKDMHATWELPAALLLPLAYAPVLPLIRLALTQWRIHRIAPYQRLFSACATGLSYIAAAVTFHALLRVVHGTVSQPGSRALAWMGISAACAVVQWIVYQALSVILLKGTDPGLRLRDEHFAKESLYSDLNERCVAVLVTFCAAFSWIALLFAAPCISLLQRSLRHNRLLNDSQIDAKTGLLNAGTWEHQASTEVARAVRTRTPLAIALLDIDRFKVINDTYGHLVGDQVLSEIAHLVSSMLRRYDVAGRWGGEEFSLLLPHTRAVDASRVAERIRSHIAALRIIVPGATGGERVHVTVSLGVAALDSGTDRPLADLMAAADAALYRAKSSGRDQVQMISTTRGLSAVSSASGEGDGEAPAKPDVFRRALTS